MKIFFKAASVLLLTISIVACGSSSSNALVSSAAEDSDLEFQAMRVHWSSYFVGDKSLSFDDQLVSASSKMNVSTAQWLASYKANNSAGLWDESGFELDSTATLDVNLYSTYNRLFTMSKVYQLSTAALYQDPDLLAMLIESLNFLNLQYYKAGVSETGNWWNWELGVSRVAHNILILLYDSLPADLIANYVTATEYFVPRATHLAEGDGASGSPAAFESTGANRVDNVQVVLTRSFLTNDKIEFTAAIAALASVIAVVEAGDGFYQDGSFIQHDSLPYAGTYGQVLLEGLGKIAGVVSDPDLQETLQPIYSMIVNSFYPLMIDGRMMDMVSGRAISRRYGQNHYIGHSVLSAMLFYTESAPTDLSVQLKSIIKTQIENDNYRDFFNSPSYFRNHQLAKEIVADINISIIADRTEHRQFTSMDRVVHHRPTWTFGVAMHSNRVGNYECINGENLKGWHTADGMTYLYNQQTDHYTNYWAMVDSSKLPGTTFFSDPEQCEGQFRADGYLKQTIEWSGGSSIGNYGSVGFDFINWDDTVAAKKSWFMFDNEIVALGSGITNTAAFTAIENRKIEDDADIYVNGALLEEVTFSGILQQLDIEVAGQTNKLSYVLITPQQVDINHTINTGNFNEIGTSSLTVSAKFISAVLKHQQSDQYQYMMFPNATADYVTAAIENPSVTVLSNNDIAHAVIHQTLQLAALNFWEAGTVNDISLGDLDSISAQTALSMMIDFQSYQSDNTLSIGVSNPTQQAAPIEFDLGKAFTVISDQENRITQINSTSFSINLEGLEGRTYPFLLHEGSLQ